MDMLSRDSFYADETDIFDAICDWISEQPLAKVTKPIVTHPRRKQRCFH